MGTINKIIVRFHPVDQLGSLAPALQARLQELDIDVQVAPAEKTIEGAFEIPLHQFSHSTPPSVAELVEFVLRHIPFDFEKLPLLVEGESKIVRSLNDKIVVERFKPTVYSYTHNRYGEVAGTEETRVLFTAAIFRWLNRHNAQRGGRLYNAFLATVPSAGGTLLLQEKVDPCNLEVRVKRYHIGSPLHRYRYTERYATVQHDGRPLQKWSRFDKPIVCFDWRLPLTDEQGNRLADEPISDDYASVWMADVAAGKKLAADTFLWLEELFRKSNLLLVDICFFIDRSGTRLYGEISPDCMRVRDGLGDPGLSESLDKDLWRQGEAKKRLAERYEQLYHTIFKQ